MIDSHLPIEISEEADNDLTSIFDYTFHEFGELQAVKYLGSFKSKFEALKANPELGRKRSEIRSGLRSISNHNHIIFYKIQEDRIRIARIIHSNQNILRFFPH